MSSEAETPKEVLRKELLKMNVERSKLENEMKEWQNILQSQNVSMNDSLVDENGFPRSDVDIHQIRIARNKIICLTNDARSLMKRIEEKLFEFHEMDKQSNQTNEDKPEK